jgi:deoxycytidylate deaminase
MTSGPARVKKPRPPAPAVVDGAGAAAPDSERIGISFLTGRDNLDEHFMREALLQARRAFEADEVPVGAVVVLGNRVIARAYNQVETLKDATAHAEMIALTQAASAVGDWRLGECTLYVHQGSPVSCARARP